MIRAQLKFTRSQRVEPDTDHQPSAPEEKLEREEIVGQEKHHSDDSYLDWTAVEVTNWMVTIDRMRFEKYYEALIQNMMQEGVDGRCLQSLDKNDLHRLGIIQFRDKEDILSAIRDLCRAEEERHAEGSLVEGNVADPVTLC